MKMVRVTAKRIVVASTAVMLLLAQCNAFIPVGPLTKCMTIHRLCRRATTINPRGLWNANPVDGITSGEDGDQNNKNKKNYSSFRASWKTVTADDVKKVDAVIVDPLISVTEVLITEKGKNDVSPNNINNGFLGRLPKFEAPKIQMPKIPEIQLPEFPKMKGAEYYYDKIKRRKPDTTDTTKKKNYSPSQASWKTTSDKKIKDQSPPLQGSWKPASPMNVEMPKIPDSPKLEAPSSGEDGDQNNKNENNYSSFQASWKTTDDDVKKVDAVIVDPLISVTEVLITEKGKNDVSPNNKNNGFLGSLRVPELPKFEAPKIQMPKIPEIQLPEFPKMEGADYYYDKIKRRKPDTTDTTRKQNYSPVQASWKTTTDKSSSATLSTNTKNIDNYSPFQSSWKTSLTKPTDKPFSKLELPALPDLPGLPKIQVKEYSEEARKLSLLIDKSIKDKVNAFTGRSQYEVGDITKAIIAKVANEEFELAEITFFVRILIAVGADLSGFSAVLPVGGLIGLFGWSISMGLAERFTKVVSIEVNKRIKNNDKTGVDVDLVSLPLGITPAASDMPVSVSASSGAYNPGDLTKRALLDYTGKPSYAVGDLAGTTTSTKVDWTVLQELEECLSMEKELIEKLSRIQQETP